MQSLRGFISLEGVVSKRVAQLLRFPVHTRRVAARIIRGVGPIAYSDVPWLGALQRLAWQYADIAFAQNLLLSHHARALLVKLQPRTIDRWKDMDISQR